MMVKLQKMVSFLRGRDKVEAVGEEGLVLTDQDGGDGEAAGDGQVPARPADKVRVGMGQDFRWLPRFTRRMR